MKMCKRCSGQYLRHLATAIKSLTNRRATNTIVPSSVGIGPFISLVLVTCFLGTLLPPMVPPVGVVGVGSIFMYIFSIFYSIVFLTLYTACFIYCIIVCGFNIEQPILIFLV
jgi:hypothetical protein